MSRKKVCMAVTNNFTYDTRVYREAKTLSDNGFVVTVVATRDQNERLPGEENIDGIKVIRIEKSPKARGAFKIIKKVRRLPDIIFYGSANYQPFLKALINEKADVYHAHDLDTLLASYQASQINKSKLVYDSHEIYLETRKSALKYLLAKKDYTGLLMGLLTTLNFIFTERKFIKKADRVITVNESIASFLQKKYNLSKKPLVLMNCNELNDIKPSKLLHSQLNIDNNKRIILYQGLLSPGRGLKETVEAMKYIENKEVGLVFMGHGALKNELEEFIDRLKLNNRVFITKTVLPKELPARIASADLGIIPYENISLNNYYSTPNKIFEYLVAGVPFIVSDFPELSKFVDQGVGYTFDPEKPREIANAIDKVFSNEKILNEMKNRAKMLAKSRYNWGMESKKLLGVYEALN